MKDLLSEATLWEKGCEADKVRNNFVIPATIKLLNALRPTSILDVGAGTGFTARSVDAGLNYRANWCLLDRDVERMALADCKTPKKMTSEILCDNFLGTKLDGRKFDALYFGFTLLELGTDDDILSQIDRLCEDRGAVVIAQPDVMQDVFASASSDAELLEKFADGPVSLSKIDKFTEVEYPFQAERFESVTYKIMQRGFFLERFEKEVFDGRAVFLLAFVRRDRNETNGTY